MSMFNCLFRSIRPLFRLKAAQAGFCRVRPSTATAFGYSVLPMAISSTTTVSTSTFSSVVSVSRRGVYDLNDLKFPSRS